MGELWFCGVSLGTSEFLKFSSKTYYSNCNYILVITSFCTRLDTSVPTRPETLIRRIPMEVLCLQILVSQTRSVTSTGPTATEAMPLVQNPLRI
jgi:hypothetical protein